MIDLKTGISEWLTGMLIGVDHPNVDGIDTDYLAGELIDALGLEEERTHLLNGPELIRDASNCLIRNPDLKFLPHRRYSTEWAPE